MGPTLAGFISFIQSVMLIPTVALPLNAPVIAAAFNVAMATANPNLAVCGSPASLQINGVNPALQPTPYAYAVYNLAADRLINFAPDQEGSNYFAELRKKCNINSFVGGVIQAAGDEGTNQAMVVPEAMRYFTMRDLQTLKTPYGQTYMQFAQSAGFPFAVA